MENAVQELFSIRLKRLRERKEVTMVELANMIGMSQATISEWEKGNKFPRSGALQQLANYFNVPMEYFFKENFFLKVDSVNIPFYRPIFRKGRPIAEFIRPDEAEYIKLPSSFLGRYAGDEKLVSFKVIVDDMNVLFPKGSPVVAKLIEFNEIKDGDIVGYYYKETYGIRRFKKNELQKVIILSAESDNDDFYDIVIPFNEVNNLEIIIKIVWYGVSL